MQCERVREYYSEYLERTLDAATMASVRAHVASCPTCEREVTALGDTFSMLAAMPQAEPPADGAWEVLRRVHEARLREEAATPSVPAFLQWLRSLNPLSMGLGAGLATLVLVGATMMTGLRYTGMDFAGPLRGLFVQQQAIAPGSLPPQVDVRYGARTVEGETVNLQITAASELPDAAITVEGSSRWTVPASLLKRGWNLEIPLALPETAGAEVLRVNVDSASLGKRYSYLVVAPLGERHDQRVTLAFGYQSLETALRQLAPSLGRPVVVAGDTDTPVQLSVQDRPAKACLETLANQVGASFSTEEGAYRLTVR